MDTYSQMLCRFEKPSPTQASRLGTLTRLSVCAWIISCVWTCALATPTIAGISAPVPTQTVSRPIPSEEMTLLEEARDWISHRNGIAVDDIQMNTMDERLKVTLCEKPTLFDQPFANRHVIRARCELPRWQYFLQASWPQSLENKKNNGQTLVTNANTLNTSSPSRATPNNGSALATPVSYPNSSPSTPNANVFGEVVRTVLVFSQPLKKGTILNSSHFKKISLNVPQSDGQILTQTQEIENFELLHDMGSDQIIHSFDVKPSVMVKRGQEVTLVYGQGRGFTITVKTEALQDGTMGEQVRLKNVESGRIISGVVTGFSEAKGL
jgi:flagellar basal body P-ring formation protein FlgA